MSSILRRCLIAFASVDLFFTPGVTFCFLSLFHYPPGGVRRAIILTSAMAIVKLTVLLVEVRRRALPVERWQRAVAAGTTVTEDDLAAAAAAAYRGPVALGKLWALLWVALLSILSAFTLWEQAQAGHSLARGLPIAVAFIPTVLLGAGTLATILAGFLFAPPAGQISIEAHERGVPVPVRTMSLRVQLAFLAFGLCMAPTCFLAAFSGAMLMDGARASAANLFLLGMFFILPLVFGVVGAVALSAMFSGSISGVSRVLHQIASSGGKLEGIGRVPAYFRNEFGELADRVNVMVDRLIEARRQLETAHEAQIRAEKLASIGQLAATVGHELRNPLGAVRNAHAYVTARLARHPELVQAEPKVITFLELSSREIDACSRLIADLLDFARERPLTLEPLPLHPLVDEAISLVPARDNVKVANQVPGDLAVPLLDKEQFRRIIINLVQNAVEAIPEGQPGRVQVEAHHAAASGWQVVIADDGPGIPPGVAERIFDPLFTTKVKGTGLGLAVVKSVVRRHGGAIRLETAPETGTRFLIEWPV